MIFTDLDAARKPLHSDWHRVSPDFNLRFSLVNGTFRIDWGPRWPSRPEIEPLLPSYRAALREFFGAAVDRGVRRIGVFDLLEV